MPLTSNYNYGLETVLEPANLTAPVDEQVIRQLLQAAQQKLQTSRIPHFLKVTQYIKLCCLAFQNSLLEEQKAALDNLYHTLLQWLWECEPDWWEQCVITDSCKIISCNARIRDLLQPLEDFVERFSEV